MIAKSQQMSKKLREIFYRSQIAVVPFGTTPYHAMMFERAGFEAFYMSGSMTAGWLLGWPDVGVTTSREMADNANRIAKTINIPIFADIDTGYGTAINVYRSIQEYIWAGVSGCHLEDQEFPKKSGSQAGRRLISIDEAVGKYKAAIDARDELDPNFVICARSDARGSEGGGFDEVLKRAKAYEKVGVDVIFFESMQSWEECKIALKSVSIPAFCLLHEVIYRNEDGSLRPGPSLKEQEEAGQAIALLGLGLMPGQQAAWEAILDFKERGMEAIHEWRVIQQNTPLERRIPPLTSYGKVRELEEKFLPKELQRDYENTLGATPEGGLNRPGGKRME